MTITKSERKRISEESIRVFFRPPANGSIPAEDIPVITPNSRAFDNLPEPTDEQLMALLNIFDVPKEPTK